MQDISRTLMHNQMQLKLADIVTRFEMALLPRGEFYCCVGIQADAFVYGSSSSSGGGSARRPTERIGPKFTGIFVYNVKMCLATE